MARVTTVLLRPGVYEAPQGTLRASPSRLRKWADKFARMRELGIRIPVAWGHQSDAEPADEEQRKKRQYWLSAYNAGYLEDMSVDPTTGALTGHLDVPGCEEEDGKLVAWVRLPDGREVKSAVGEVSAAVRNWKDGQGRYWPDSIIHVALTPLPVVAGQEGFRSLGSLGMASRESTIYLSLSTRKGDAMDDEELDLDEGEEEIAEGAAKGAAEGEEEAAEETTETAPAPETPAGRAGAERINEVIRCLSAFNVHLPPDTTVDNLPERICVACHGVAEGKAEPEEEAMEPNPEEPTDTLAGEDRGVTFPTEEEQRPVMMSLTTAKSQRERRLLEKAEQSHKQDLQRKIESLRKRGMPAHLARSYTERLSGYSLSLTDDLEVHPKALDRELALADSLLPKRSQYLGRVKNRVREEQRPGHNDEHESAAEIKARAKKVSHNASE